MSEEEELEGEKEGYTKEELEESVPFKYAITSYGADYPVDSLVKRMQEGAIFIPPFQRGYVWSHTQASLFIESLLLGLPVPGIFLYREEETKKLLVVDGQQRLRTLQYFQEGVFPPTQREFALRGISSEFNTATYKTLSEGDRLRLNDSVLHATIVKQDKPSEDKSSIYHLFNRLNTGGTLLLPQEIRACIYHGPFSDLLKQINSNLGWRSIYGPISKRMRDQELILRFFALHFSQDSYTRPMKEFLNTYMGKNRYLKLQSESLLSEIFALTIGTAFSCLGVNAFKPVRNLNAAVYDAVMVGLARRLAKGGILRTEMVRTRYNELLKNSAFASATESGTSQEGNVSQRTKLATAAFADVQ